MGMDRFRLMAHSSKCRSSSTSSTDSDQDGGKRVYRVVVMGAAGVGKTCIIKRFLYEQFVSQYKETVEDLYRGEYEVNGMELTLDIMDTAGAYQFPAMRDLAIKNGDAFVLVYSIDDETSFDTVKNIREQILQVKDEEAVPIVVVGNKIDIENIDSTSAGSVSSAEDIPVRPVDKQTAESTANMDWGTGYIEASAKDDTNIVGIFKELLVQARIQYALSPAVRRRRQSAPSPSKTTPRKKRNSCSIN